MFVAPSYAHCVEPPCWGQRRRAEPKSDTEPAVHDVAPRIPDGLGSRIWRVCNVWATSRRSSRSGDREGDTRVQPTWYLSALSNLLSDVTAVSHDRPHSPYPDLTSDTT